MHEASYKTGETHARFRHHQSDVPHSEGHDLP